MLVSVFTSSSHTRHLDECYRSLAAQSYPDWEWVVMLGGKAGGWAPPTPDPRVAVTPAGAIKHRGAVKRAACERARGDILVELDHGDLLAPGALLDVTDALADPRFVFAYSDFTQIEDDGSPSWERYDESNGWTYSEVRLNGRAHLRCHALAATPHNLAYIWYAPHHVRAFRRTAYEAVGGYDASRAVLDDQDLMIRLFQHGAFRHVDACSYLQRRPARETPADRAANAQVQEETVANYLEHIEALALAWSAREGLAAVTVRTPVAPEPEGEDERLRVQPLDPGRPHLPYDDGSVGVVKAVDVLQRVADRAAFLDECARVLHPSGLLLTDTPSTDGRGAFQDPSHVAFYNENSFMYFTQSRLRASLPALTSRWQVSHLQTYWPSDVHQQLDIPYVKANLLPLKGGPRQGGPILC